MTVWPLSLIDLATSLTPLRPKLPQIMETAVTFDILGLERQNWYQTIQKADVYISLFIT